MGAAVLLLGLVAYAGLRRHPLVARLGMTALVLVTGGIVVAQVATITPDGAVGDWSVGSAHWAGTSSETAARQTMPRTSWRRSWPGTMAMRISGSIC
jgi:hypothetical protein